MRQFCLLKSLLMAMALVVTLQFSASAQPLTTFVESLEAKIAGSHTVVKGTIESIKQSPVDYDFNPVQETEPNGFVELTITVRVAECFKGEVNEPTFTGGKIFTRTWDANNRSHSLMVESVKRTSLRCCGSARRLKPRASTEIRTHLCTFRI